jgi:hypothetical protein
MMLSVAVSLLSGNLISGAKTARDFCSTERLGCVGIARGVAPLEMYADVSRDIEQARGGFCYILLVTRMSIVGEDEVCRRLGVAFIKVRQASYSGAKVWVICVEITGIW